MTDKNKKIAIGSVLGGGLIVSLILWTTVKPFAGEMDKGLEGKKMKFTCPKCKNQFELTMAESKALRYANEGAIPCPKCKSMDTIKEGVKVQMGKPPSFASDAAKTEDGAPAAEAPAGPPKVSGGRIPGRSEP